ncbi:MAG: TetR/AcrR family transcriptional regulator [Thermodesulfobacteriota bacterium]
MATYSKGEDTRDHILKTTRDLLTTQGFRNTSIANIIAATGVKKGNLYYHFPSKEELALAVLEDAKSEFFDFLGDSFQGDDAIAKIINSCDTLLEFLQQRNFVGGCLFGNTALEMTDNNVRFATIIRDVFAHWVELIAGYLRDAQAQEGFQSPIPPVALATTVVATIEGGIMMSRVDGGEGLADCILTLKAILGRPVPPA